MKTIAEAVQDYLALRRSLGFKLKKHRRLLEEFVKFLEQKRTSRITSLLALEWPVEPQHLQPVEWAARLSILRGFARYWSATDPMTEVPPSGLLSHRRNRAKPYLYSDEQIRQLLEAARTMPATHRLQPWTYHCLLGLLAVTGLRISEALNLSPADIDWSEGILTIRNSKFGKSRLIPLHASSLTVLADYAARRDSLFAGRNAAYFFPSRRAGRLDEGQVRRTLASVVPPPAAVRDCMTSVIDSQSRRCCTGTTTEKTSDGVYLSCPPISATDMSPIPIGT